MIDEFPISLYLLWLLPGVAICFFAGIAYRAFKDPFHPAIVTAPLFFYYYTVWPILLNSTNAAIVELFSESSLGLPLAIMAFGVLALYLAFTLPLTRRLRHQIKLGSPIGVSAFVQHVSGRTRTRLMHASIALGLVASAAYWYTITAAGGFFVAYSTVKGGGYSESGYLGDAPLLAYPALLFLALSRQSIKFRIVDFLLSIAIASPHILQGIFGGRRGPLYTSLFCIFGCWVIAQGRPPKLRQFFMVSLALALSIVIVFSQRSFVYFGSEDQFDLNRIGLIFSEDDLEANDYVANIASLKRSLALSDYFWGKRYLSTILVRPIPKQIWATKYDDIGADRWLNYWSGEGEQAFLKTSGFSPPNGSAIGLVADMFLEFSFFYLIPIYFFGRFILACWVRHRTEGGIWSVLYIQIIMLSVYLPSQSFLAFFQRFMVVSILSIFVWRFWLRMPLTYRSVMLHGLKLKR